MPVSLTMLFTTSENPGSECSTVGPERLLLGGSIGPHVGLRERERPFWSNEWTVIYKEGAEDEGRWGERFASVDLSNPDLIIVVLCGA